MTGDSLYLFAGMRTRNCRRLGETVCKSVEPVSILKEGVYVGNNWLQRDRIEALAVADGFKTVEDFVLFFEEQYGLPANGLELIKW